MTREGKFDKITIVIYRTSPHMVVEGNLWNLVDFEILLVKFRIIPQIPAETD